MVVGKVNRESYCHQSIIPNHVKRKDFSPETHIIVLVSFSRSQFVLHFYTVRNGEVLSAMPTFTMSSCSSVLALMFMPIVSHWTTLFTLYVCVRLICWLLFCFDWFVSVLPVWVVYTAVHPQPDLLSALCSGRSNSRLSGCGIRLWRGLYLT